MRATGIEELSLRHPAGTTRIVVGEGALAAEGGRLAEIARGRTAFVVTTPRVESLHGERLAGIEAASRATHRLRVPEGEAAKTIAEAERLWSAMLAAGGKRDSLVVAFGGGSVGDLAGFVAGCFLRGVAWVQLPTTLLAQVDASIGGKTAVDLPRAKNAVGVFHHPVAVVGDTRVLSTLPRAELRSGLVEAAKMGALLDPELFRSIEAGLESLLAGDTTALAPVVARGAAAKARVVEADPAETGARRLLNFGHTLGHAIETVAGHGTLLHGDAVAHGILFACRLAEGRGADAETGARAAALFRRMEIPALPRLEAPALLAAMARDKKAREGSVHWVLPVRFGRAEIVPVAESEVAAALRSFLAGG